MGAFDPAPGHHEKRSPNDNHGIAVAREIDLPIFDLMHLDANQHENHASRVAALRFLLDQGGRTDCFHYVKPALPRTPMGVAAQLGHAHWISVFAELGQTIDVPGLLWESPQDMAVTLGRIDFLRELVAYGVDLHGYRDRNGRSCLHKATFSDKHAVIRELVAMGLDLEARCDQGETVIFESLMDIETLELVHSLGANLDVTTPYGDHLSHEAFRPEHDVPPEVQKYLILHGIALDRPNAEGERVIDWLDQLDPNVAAMIRARDAQKAANLALAEIERELHAGGAPRMA